MAKQDVISGKTTAVRGRAIPFPRVIKTLLDWTAISSTIAVLGNGKIIVDLDSLEDYHEGLFKIEVLMQNNSATAAGASKTLTLKFATFNGMVWDQATGLSPLATDENVDSSAVYSNLSVDVVFAPAAGAGTVVTLPNTTLTSTAGTLYAATANLVVEGRFLAFWYDISGVTAGASVKVKINLVRL